jgi:Lrp/AsnC family transcriptional regulator, leucine-responsive regulatory protein
MADGEICVQNISVYEIYVLYNLAEKYYCNMTDNSESTIELDNVDWALLAQLQADASLSNQDLAELVHVSPPTCLRRVKRLRESGLIARQVAILDSDLLARVTGHGLQAIVEITLDRQGDKEQQAFEARVAQDASVQQCYRVSPGPDFILVVHTADMPGYLALAQRLFTSDANVRNVKAFFSLRRAKFEPAVPFAPR